MFRGFYLPSLHSVSLCVAYQLQKKQMNIKGIMALPLPIWVFILYLSKYDVMMHKNGLKVKKNYAKSL